MSKQISDEQFDTLMKSMIADAAMDASLVDDIAESPTVWWQAQRRIAEQKEATSVAWPPIAKVWRFLMVGIPVAAAVAILISFVVFRPVLDTADQARRAEIDTAIASVPAASMPLPKPDARQIEPAAVKKAVHRDRDARSLAAYKKPAVTHPVETAKPEIKTEFIALSFARDAESGQIVRVKVPSSMMVTLGLVATVEKPSNLVDAEVIVGDDGLTRAIRFIR